MNNTKMKLAVLLVKNLGKEKTKIWLFDEKIKIK